MFSSRFPGDITPNRQTRILERKRAAGIEPIDLTESNPTRCGFTYREAEILRAISKKEALSYEPHPRGLSSAREAVSAYHAGRGRPADAGRMHLTASTSEAYAFLLKLLTDKGDAVLVPRPSYPLVEFLAAMEDVEIIPYDLSCADGAGWARQAALPDLAGTRRCKALIVVNPNNPTGNYTGAEEMSRLVAFCERHRLALISDEVFIDYPLESGSPGDASSAMHSATGILAFTLGGFSKTLALPQLKLGWISTSGPAGLARQAVERLDLIADTYLSVNTPVLHAAAALLETAQSIQDEIRQRCRRNLSVLRRALRDLETANIPEVEAGWYATIRLAGDTDEEELACALLDEYEVMVHPGYFFDFPEQKHLVLSLLAEESKFREGIRRLAECLLNRKQRQTTPAE